jgi:hypothetical protein
VGRPAGPSGLNSEQELFSNKNWIFEFTKALEICRRRFRRNFDMRIFLNSSRLLRILEKYNMPCHAMHPIQDLFLEGFSYVL